MRPLRFVLLATLLAHGCVLGDSSEDDDEPGIEDPTDPPTATDDSVDASELDDIAVETDDEPVVAELAAGTYQNPVAANCADPGVIRVDTAAGPTFRAACTGGNFPLFKSDDLVHWTAAGHLFGGTNKPAWAAGNNWAPEIHHIGTGFVAYFVALSTVRHKMCIGAARASTIDGPWTDIGHPLVCNSHVSLIDPNVYTSVSGQHFLYYKTDGNGLSPQEKTIIYGQALTADGVHLAGARHRLIMNSLAWEGDVVEAPWVMHRGKYYYLFYSGYRYCNDSYGVGVARATSPLGPFHKRSAPILHSNAKWGGPGHNSTVGVHGHDFIIYHAWAGSHACSDGGNRELLVDRITWSGGWPFVNSGTPGRGVHTAPLRQ